MVLKYLLQIDSLHKNDSSYTSIGIRLLENNNDRFQRISAKEVITYENVTIILVMETFKDKTYERTLHFSNPSIFLSL